jgi:excisionase family DNA binding protein
MRYLTTGEVAKLFSVTRDTVLKWIKQGKLPARKTAGGHFRIPEEALQQSLGTPPKTIPQSEASSHPEPPIYCWEYFARDGKTKEQCLDCLVYKVKGTKCYEVADFLKKIGFGATCCSSDCEDCGYYKLGLSRSPKVLIVTNNESLEESLTRESGSGRMELKFARWDFDCSFVIDSFRPEYVIVDCQDDFGRYERLSRHLKNDPRIPGVKILLAVPWPRKSAADFREDPTVIGLPLTISALEKHLETLQALRAADRGSSTIPQRPDNPRIAPPDVRV